MQRRLVYERTVTTHNRFSKVLARSGLTHPLFLIVAILITAADLWSKAWAWALVDQHGRYPVFEPYFQIVQAENTGTIWGLCQNAEEMGHETELALRALESSRAPNATARGHRRLRVPDPAMR